MKQTAVDFAVEQLEKLIPTGNQIIIGIILDKAKEMERDQIENSYTNGVWWGHKMEPEQYYKANFEKK
jgi:hypothetical protein